MPGSDLLVGKIVGVHGIRGDLKVCSYVESPSIFQPDRSVKIKIGDDRPRQYSVKQARAYKQTILLCLKEVTTVEQAKKMIGADIFIDKNRLPALEKGSYYWFDIIGLSVFALGHRYLGRIESIIRTNSNDVYVVKNDGGEILIPAVESVVVDIDIGGQTMRVDLPEGLE